MKKSFVKSIVSVIFAFSFATSAHAAETVIDKCGVIRPSKALVRQKIESLGYTLGVVPDEYVGVRCEQEYGHWTEDGRYVVVNHPTTLVAGMSVYLDANGVPAYFHLCGNALSGIQQHSTASVGCQTNNTVASSGVDWWGGIKDVLGLGIQAYSARYSGGGYQSGGYHVGYVQPVYQPPVYQPHQEVSHPVIKVIVKTGGNVQNVNQNQGQGQSQGHEGYPPVCTPPPVVVPPPVVCHPTPPPICTPVPTPTPCPSISPIDPAHTNNTTSYNGAGDVVSADGIQHLDSTRLRMMKKSLVASNGAATSNQTNTAVAPARGNKKGGRGLNGSQNPLIAPASQGQSDVVSQPQPLSSQVQKLPGTGKGKNRSNNNLVQQSLQPRPAQPQEMQQQRQQRRPQMQMQQQPRRQPQQMQQRPRLQPQPQMQRQQRQQMQQPRQQRQQMQSFRPNRGGGGGGGGKHRR